MMLLTLAAFAVLRYDVGWDYMNYYEFASDDGSLAMARERYSFLWYWLFEFAHGLKMPHLAIAIPAVATYAFVYQAIRLLSNGNRVEMSDALLVYAMWPFFYLGSFSTIRQSLAVAVCLLIFALLYKRQWIWAAVLFAVNLLVHPSSLLALVYLPIALYAKRIPIVLVGLVGVGVMMAIENWSDIIVLMDVEAFNEYAETYMDQEDEFGSMLSLLLGVVALFLMVTALLDKKQNIWQNKLSIVVAVALCVDIFIYQSDLPSVITRTFAYFSIFLIVVFFDGLRRFPYVKLFRTLLTCALVMLFFIYLERTTHSVSMQDVDTASNFVPYKTLLSK